MGDIEIEYSKEFEKDISELFGQIPFLAHNVKGYKLNVQRNADQKKIDISFLIKDRKDQTEEVIESFLDFCIKEKLSGIEVDREEKLVTFDYPTNILEILDLYIGKNPSQIDDDKTKILGEYLDVIVETHLQDQIPENLQDLVPYEEKLVHLKYRRTADVLGQAYLTILGNVTDRDDFMGIQLGYAETEEGTYNMIFQCPKLDDESDLVDPDSMDALQKLYGELRLLSDETNLKFKMYKEGDAFEIFAKTPLEHVKLIDEFFTEYELFGTEQVALDNLDENGDEVESGRLQQRYYNAVEGGKSALEDIKRDFPDRWLETYPMQNYTSENGVHLAIALISTATSSISLSQIEATIRDELGKPLKPHHRPFAVH